jgi:integrase/recombinase XerC
MCRYRDRKTAPCAMSPWRLPYRTPQSTWRHISVVCDKAGVAPKGLRRLRHALGIHLYVETHDREETARRLGHVTLETTRGYATWSGRWLRDTPSVW